MLQPRQSRGADSAAVPPAGPEHSLCSRDVNDLPGSGWNLAPIDNVMMKAIPAAFVANRVADRPAGHSLVVEAAD